MENVVSVKNDHNDNAHERMYSMLDGDALTAVEHLEFAEFAVDGGETLIFNILEARYPDGDPIYRAGKALFDVLEVSAREGERLSGQPGPNRYACQRGAGIAFADMVKGFLCLHRCGFSDDQRAVVLGRTGGKYEIASIAPALRSCFPEYRVPKLNRRSHGVFVSDMPLEEEEEEEIDEETSIDGLEDVEKFINEDDESDFVLEEDEVREVLATAWKRQEISKERLRRGFGKPSKSAATPATRKFRAEVEELKLRTKCDRCGNVDIRQENVHQNRHKVEEETNPGRKMNILPRKTGREAYFCDWSPGDEPRFQCFFESRHGSMLDRIRRRCSLLKKSKRLRLDRKQVSSESTRDRMADGQTAFENRFGKQKS